MINGLTFKRINTGDPAYQHVFNLRDVMLRQPIGLSLHDEDLSGEVNDHILVAEKGGTIIACLILTPKPGNKVQLRQMAVADNYQGQGVGRALVSYAEEYATKQGYQSIILHARVYARGFYDNTGYKQVGGVFTEVGIPHIKMEKLIS